MWDVGPQRYAIGEVPVERDLTSIDITQGSLT